MTCAIVAMVSREAGVYKREREREREREKQFTVSARVQGPFNEILILKSGDGTGNFVFY